MTIRKWLDDLHAEFIKRFPDCKTWGDIIKEIDRLQENQK